MSIQMYLGTCGTTLPVGTDEMLGQPGRRPHHCVHITVGRNVAGMESREVGSIGKQASGVHED